MTTAPLLSLLAVLSTAPVTPSGTATVSLAELVPLLEAKNAPEGKSPPPADAVLAFSQLKGRVTPDALLVDAHFEVDVLADGKWAKVCLLQLSEDAYLTARPRLDGATVAEVDGQLCLLSREAGSYVVDASLTVRAEKKGGGRRVSFAPLAKGPSAPLLLEVDPAFRLTEPSSDDPSLAVTPTQGRYVVAWQAASPLSSGKPKAVERPPLEPKVTRADASWVTTLEGKLGLRLRYALQLDREQSFSVAVPEGLKVERVTVNGRPLAVAPESGALTLAVAPSSVGESRGQVELLFSEELGVFHLSGMLKLSLPKASWPVSELYAQAYFPAVFHYRREGGSLEQFEGGGAPQEALPGKVLHFRQFLVSSSRPTLELGYSVDIDKSYFR